jgi:hypothetical protein
VVHRFKFKPCTKYRKWACLHSFNNSTIKRKTESRSFLKKEVIFSRRKMYLVSTRHKIPLLENGILSLGQSIKMEHQNINLLNLKKEVPGFSRITK